MTSPHTMQADMNWFAVLAHHATRTPDQAITVFEGETTTYGRDGRARGRRWPPACPTRGVGAGRRGGAPLVQLPRVPRDGVRGQPPRRDRHADQLAARRAGGALHPRALRTPGRSCATRRSSTSPTTRRRASRPRSSRACVSAAAPDGWTHPGRPAGERRSGGARPGGGRRRPPPDVHVGHHRTAQGRDAHPRQPGVEEPRPHRRVRLHERRSRAGLRAALPRRRARPHDHVADRRGCDDDHPSLVRRRRCGRRARAVPGDHRVAGAGDGQRDHGLARHRAARPVVGAGDHQRRREDADPAHRADPARLPVGVVRRRLRAHRDGLRRHLPRPGQHRHASSAASAVRACTSSSTSGTTQGRSVPAGERGEIVLRGPKVFKGYWRDPDATAAAFAGGWFHTGRHRRPRRRRLPVHRRPAQGHDRVRR